MDKLRSLEYFIAAAESGSFSGAARRLGVSVAAVSKLVGVLERSVGAQLFERHSDGLAPTAAGARYLESCRSALRLLAEADEQLTVSAPRGTVVVGAPTNIMQECLTPALPRFNALYPEIQLDIRLVMQPTEANARGVDVFVLLGWPQATDLVQRRVGATSFVVCASPSYWNAHGIPRHPSELEQHNCLTVRAINGTLMDVWRFQRGDERVSVTARGWLLADNAQRDVVRRTVLAGGGVARVPDWLKRRGQDLATGRLVAALTDWEQPDVAPISVLYPPSVRRVPRVRAFIAFVTQLFRNIEEQRENRSAASTREPEWLRTHYPRASLAPTRRR